eukprot:1324387-Rhodomonas_salina.3
MVMVMVMVMVTVMVIGMDSLEESLRRQRAAASSSSLSIASCNACSSRVLASSCPPPQHTPLSTAGSQHRTVNPDPEYALRLSILDRTHARKLPWTSTEPRASAARAGHFTCREMRSFRVLSSSITCTAASFSRGCCRESQRPRRPCTGIRGTCKETHASHAGPKAVASKQMQFSGPPLSVLRSEPTCSAPLLVVSPGQKLSVPPGLSTVQTCSDRSLHLWPGQKWPSFRLVQD